MKFSPAPWVNVKHPGVEFYAEEILSGDPFTFVRYGEGEWHFSIPNCPKKNHWQYREWRDDDAQERLRNTLLNYHDHPRYWMGIWHHHHFRITEFVQRWLEETGLDELDWHWGGVWRSGTETNTLFPVVDAIRKQDLPVVIVGPPSIRSIEKKLDIAKFIEIHPLFAYYDIDEIVESILAFDEPALISFSAGGTAKIIMHELFPVIGERSYMIDFGAMWEGLCGNRGKRAYQKGLTAERIKKAWGTK